MTDPHVSNGEWMNEEEFGIHWGRYQPLKHVTFSLFYYTFGYRGGMRISGHEQSLSSQLFAVVVNLHLFLIVCPASSRVLAGVAAEQLLLLPLREPIFASANPESWLRTVAAFLGDSRLRQNFARCEDHDSLRVVSVQQRFDNTLVKIGPFYPWDKLG